MTEQSPRSMDGPTFLLATASLLVAIPATILALTGLGVAGALIAMAICRFFGRPHLALGLFAVAAPLLAFSLLLSSSANVWSVAFPAYLATVRHGSFPWVTARIWLDPTELTLDRLALVAVGLIAGGLVELIAEGRRKSRMTILQQGGAVLTKRAPIAYFSAWLAPLLPASIRQKYTLLGSHLALGFWLWFSDADANHHVLCTGTTGKGKSVTISNYLETKIRRGEGFVFLDGKGDTEFADRVRKYAQIHNRPTYIFNALNLAESCAYNPLACGDYTSKADRIMRLRPRTESPHHEALSKSFLQTVFKALAFQNVDVDLFQLSKVLSIAALLRLVGRRGFANPERQALVNEINSHSVAEQTSIEGLRADIAFLVNSSLGVLFDTQRAIREGRKVLNLETARRENAVVYFVLPPLLFQNAAPAIGQLVINDLKSVATTSRSPWMMLFDEFSVFSTINVLQLINMGRTFGVCAVLSTQSLADFDAGAPELGSAFGRQVRGSINTFIIHQVNDPDDAENLARIVGTSTDVELTAQMENEKFTGGASARSVRQFRVHPDDLKFLGTGEAIIINKNNGSVSRIAVRKSAI